jgi:hypothetical protein
VAEDFGQESLDARLGWRPLKTSILSVLHIVSLLRKVNVMLILMPFQEYFLVGQKFLFMSVRFSLVWGFRFSLSKCSLVYSFNIKNVLKQSILNLKKQNIKYQYLLNRLSSKNATSPSHILTSPFTVGVYHSEG